MNSPTKKPLDTAHPRVGFFMPDEKELHQMNNYLNLLDHIVDRTDNTLFKRTIRLPSGRQMTLPGHKAQRALALATLIKGHPTNTYLFTFSYYLTRIPALIQFLEDDGLESGINSNPMDFTPHQIKRSRSKPFHKFNMRPEYQQAMLDAGWEQWADVVISYWEDVNDIKIISMPFHWERKHN
jgi:hypothetical protein